MKVSDDKPKELVMSEKTQRSNTKAFVPVAHSNGYTDLPSKLTSSLYLLDQLSEEEEDELEETATWSNSTTPTSHVPVPSGWSDVTLTGSITGRSSYASWEEDEGVLDRLAGEQVGLMFDAVDQSLYEGRSTGRDHMDGECQEWRNNFPHFRIKGTHLLDSLDDGTEIVDPVVVDSGGDSAPIQQLSLEPPNDSELAVVGKAMKIHPPPPLATGDTSEDPPGLHYEEILTSDGVVEEYFAYNYNTSGIDDESSLNRLSRRRGHRYHKLPPISPSACLRDTVLGLVFDQIWTEVATTLHPLLTKYGRMASRRDSFSEGNSLLPSQSHVPIHEFYLPADGAPPIRGGHSGLQSVKRRPVAPGSLVPGGMVSAHTMDLPSLQKVMTIKPVPLQQRIPSSTLTPSISTNNSAFHIQQSSAVNAVDSSDSTIFHEFSSSRFITSSRQMSFVYTPIPPKGSDQKIASGKLGNKRNPLKPLEVPRTPALPMMDDDLKEFGGLRGQRLIRHTQLPPLDPSQFDVTKSTQIPQTSSGARGHVTFSNRIVSAVDTRGSDSSSMLNKKHHILAFTSDLRPNTSQTLHRSETPLTRRTSNISIGFSKPPGSSSSPIKVVGYAANLHGDPVLWEEQEEGEEEGLDDIIQSPYINGAKPLPRSGHSRLKLAHHGGPIR